MITGGQSEDLRYLSTRPSAMGVRFHPAFATAARVAVILVPPFGWEAMASHRSLREWAKMLAEAGVASLRMDLPGTGDSAGSPRDPRQLDGWTDGVAASAAWLSNETSGARIVAAGLGLGGLLACRVLAEGGPIDDLVLWGAPARGRAVVRELRAFARMEESWQLSQGGTPEAEPLPDGWEAPGGYLLSPETVSDLEALDVTGLEVRAGADRRALLLERDGRPVDPRLQGWLEAAGVAVTVAPGDGYGELTSDPETGQLPTEAFRRATAWIRESAAGAASAPRGPGAPEAKDALVLSTDAGVIRETPFTVAQSFGQLEGVLARPADAEEPAPLCAVLLNAGTQRRIGPNRMWVEVARRWAARGVPTLRLDLKSIGEADGPTGPWTRTADFYAPAYVDEIRAALDGLQAAGVADSFLLAGKCSGAYWSLHTAVADPRVAAAVMINPKLLVWDDAIEASRDTRLVRERLAASGAWRRVLRREVPPRRVLELVGSLAGRVLRAPFRLPGRLAERARARRSGGDDLDRTFDALRDRGARGLLLFAGREPLYEEMDAEGRLAGLGTRWPNLSLERIALPVDTHTLRPIWLQHRVHALLDQALEAEIARR